MDRPHCSPAKAGRACGRYWRASGWINHCGSMRTPRTSSAAVLLDCSASSSRSALRVRPSISCGRATTAGVPSGAETAAATRKPCLRRLVTHGMRPSSTQCAPSWRAPICSDSMPLRNFMAFDSAVAPATSPASKGASQACDKAALGLRSRYSMKTRWPQATKAAATECSATRDTASMASPMSVPGAPPCAAGTPRRNTPAAANCGRTSAASWLPSSSAPAWVSSQAVSPGDSRGSGCRAVIARRSRRRRRAVRSAASAPGCCRNCRSSPAPRQRSLPARCRRCSRPRAAPAARRR